MTSPHSDGERKVINAKVCPVAFEILATYCAHHGVTKAAGIDAMLHLAMVNGSEFAELARRIDVDRRNRE